MAESVKVIVRCRPMNTRENNLKCKACIKCDDTTNKVSIFKPDEKSAQPKNFTFDGAYFVDSTTRQIYEDVGFALVDGVLEGYNGTVFAYGQTGCGKSFSMQGITDPPEQRGIIPRAFEHIFEQIDVDEADTKYLVQASYLEIYNEEIRDLLGKDVKQKLELRESPDKGVYTQGLTQHIVKTMGGCIKLMEKGWMSRSTGATLMNAESSRSHSIFAIRIEMCEPDEASTEEKIKVGKLNLVDLAGSERQGKTGATGERLREATKINLSLSALGNVISALVDGKSKHIPYRDSKLTRLLQDSLGGNTKTLMVACISPADNNYDETLSTLRYANRAKNIKNKPKINEDPKDALLREYAEEISRLKAMLEGKIPMSVDGVTSQQTVTKEIEYIVKETDSEENLRLKQEYEDQIAELNRKYEEEKMTKMKLNEELETLRQSYDEKLQQTDSTSSTIASSTIASSTIALSTMTTSDMAVSPLVGGIEDIISGVSIATSPLAGEETPGSQYSESHGSEGQGSETMSQTMDVQSISSVNTPQPVYDEPVDYSIQLSIQQAEKLSSKQLSNLVLTPSQVRILGYDGPVTPAHVACLALSAGQIAQLDLTKEQRAELSPYQDSVLSMLDEQCEKLAYDQLLSYVNLLKTTKPLKLTFDQAQSLTSKQLGSLALSKEQSKACGGAETAQALTLEQISELKLSPAQVAQLRLTEDQIADMDEDQYETATQVSKLLEKHELMCVLSDPKLKDIQTVTLTSSQATQLDPELVHSLPLTDVQTKIIKEYKDSFTNIDVSDIDQLPLLPHQVKHLKVDESCDESLTKSQSKKVSNSIQTQTYVENVAIATMVDMEEGLTKTVTLSPAETATITKEQLAKIQVAVSAAHVSLINPDLAEPLTLTPIEIQQMSLTEEQIQQIKAKKVKRIEKHGKIVKKLKKQSAALLECSVDRGSPEPHLVLTHDQAAQIGGSVAPTKQQQETLHIEPGRQLDSEDLGGLVLTPGQIAQLNIPQHSMETLLKPEQMETALVAKQNVVKQDALKRLKEISPLEEIEMVLTENQIKTLSPRQLSGLTLTPEQCDILGLVKGQTVSLDEIALITLNGQQIIQLKLSDNQLASFSSQQKMIMSSVTSRAVQELAYLNTNEEAGLLQLTVDQIQMVSEEQIAKLTLTQSQFAQLGLDRSDVVSRDQIASLQLTASQLSQVSLTGQQVSFLSQDQKQKLNAALEVVENTGLLEEVLRLTGVIPVSKQAAKEGRTKGGKEKEIKEKESKEKDRKEEEEVRGPEEETSKAKFIRLTAEQASLLSKSQLESLVLTEEQLSLLGITEDEVKDLVPSQIAQLLFTQNQIAALKLSNNQLKGMRSKTSKLSDVNAKRKAMPRLQEMPLTEAAVEISDADQEEAIRMHQAALQKLQELQGNVVQSGADLQVKASKKEIKEKLKRRRDAAEAKRRKLRRAMEEGDDEGVIEELFNLQMEEVEVRNKKVGRIKEKYEEKVNEIKDLTEEFQTQREDYLDSIRQQSQESKLLQQILDQIQPLLRRDSNYYNLDAIKRDCKWSPETGSWLLPPVMITRTKLPTPADIPSHKSSSGIQPAYMDLPDDMKIRAKLASTENSDYFKSTRAQRLLQENKLYNGGGHGGSRNFLDDNDVLGRGPRNVLDPIDKRKKRSRNKQNF
ncbi:kinesin-like protein KIF17 isoform X2 [Bolinopsis microptera]|uniref:kinesin-like protein KIF17 isoform X2 n=1 Tax=Bolinopsis microptera TaxID=2820187 RepID=UPI003078B084